MEFEKQLAADRHLRQQLRQETLDHYCQKLITKCQNKIQRFEKAYKNKLRTLTIDDQTAEIKLVKFCLLRSDRYIHSLLEYEQREFKVKIYRPKTFFKYYEYDLAEIADRCRVLLQNVNHNLNSKGLGLIFRYHSKHQRWAFDTVTDIYLTLVLRPSN